MIVFPRRFCCTRSRLHHSHSHNRTVSANWIVSLVPRFDPFQPSLKHCSLSISGLHYRPPLYQPSHVRPCGIPDASITYSFMSTWGVELYNSLRGHLLGFPVLIEHHVTVQTQTLQIKPDGVTQNARTPRMPPTQNSADDREKTMYYWTHSFFTQKHADHALGKTTCLLVYVSRDLRFYRRQAMATGSEFPSLYL